MNLPVSARILPLLLALNLHAAPLTEAELKACARADLQKIQAITDGKTLFELGETMVGQLLTWLKLDLGKDAEPEDLKQLNALKARILAAKTCGEAMEIQKEISQADRADLRRRIRIGGGASVQEFYQFAISMEPTSLTPALLKSLKDDLIAIGAEDLARDLAYRHHEIRASVMSLLAAYKQEGKKVSASDLFHMSKDERLTADQLEARLLAQHKKNLLESLQEALK